MKVSNDVVAPALNAGDAKSTDTIDAGEFAALLAGMAGIAGLQGIVPQIDLTASAEGATTPTANPAAQLPTLVLALASMPNVDLNALAQLAGAAGQVATAAVPTEVIEVQVLSASVGEVAGEVAGPLVSTAPVITTSTAPTDATTTPAVAAPNAEAPIVLVAGGAPTGAQGQADAGDASQQGTDTATPNKTAGFTATKAPTKVTEQVAPATVEPTQVVVAPTTQDIRPNEPTKMVVPPTRIDTVAVAAARASADASRPIRLTVRLDPPNLGELRVELTARGGQVTVRLEPTNATAAPQLSSQRAAVADALERTGFQLSGFDIANPEQQQQQGQFAQQKRNAARVGDLVEEIDEIDEPATDGLRI